jgi:hypothetical protein
MNIATPVNALALTVDRNALVAALTIAARTTEKRNSIPILSCALLAASPQGLVITTTDLDQTIAVPVTANVSASGSIAVDAHQLHAGRLGPAPQRCPFCGEDPPLASLVAGRFIVGCESEACHINPQVSGDTITQAWDRWNRRARL